MNIRDVDALFRRFAQRGDAEALGQVFDATWDELFRVALHFVERPDEAEDLVQSTWLTAIEKAREPDPERRLMPWLVGVLALHAREARRRRRREVDPQRIERRSVETGDAHAESVELARAVRDALSSVPESYRAALRSHLVDGRKAVEIALDTGQRPATVRMQLHRGLEHLRKALPAGLALGGAIVLTPTRGVAAVRECVLARAAELAFASAASTSGVFVGTTLAMKKLVLGLALLALLVGLGWWLSAPDSAAGSPAPGAGVELLAGAAPAPADAQVTPPLETTQRSPIEVEAPSREIDSGERLAPFLAGCSGRVIDASSAPVANIEVALVDFEMADILGSIESLSLVRASSRTDAEGRFTLSGARPMAMQALVVDPGGQRATLRAIDAELRSGATTEIGDVRLAAGAELTGEVRGASGAPIANARVVALPLGSSEQSSELAALFVPLATDLLAVGPDEHTTLGFVDRDGTPSSVVPLSPIVASALSRAPFPTARTDDSGHFRFAELAAGRVRLVAIAEGHSGAWLDVENGVAATDVITLARLTPRVVRVVDALGKPLEGAELLARGGTPPSPELGVPVALQRMPASDVDGRSALRLAASARTATVMVRRNAHELWTVVPELALDAEALIRLPSAARWSLRVTDGDGARIEGVSVQLASREDATTPLRGASTQLACDERDPTRFAVPDLALGSYVACVTAPGFLGVLRPIELTGSELETTITLRPGEPLMVEVLDRATRHPVRDARVISTLPRFLISAASTYTDERGLAQVPRWDGEGLATTTAVSVQHPAWCTSDPEKVATSATRHLALLDHGGELRATLVGAPTTRSYTLLLFRGDSHTELARIDARAALELGNLPVGRWQYAVVPSLGSSDALAALTRGSPEPLADGTFEIASGERTELEIDMLDPSEIAAVPASVPRGGGLLTGSVMLNGAPARGCTVRAVFTRGNLTYLLATAPVDARGRFEMRDLPSGTLDLSVVSGTDERGVEAWSGQRTLSEGGFATLDVVLESGELPVRVLDAKGAVLAGVTVKAIRLGGAAREQDWTTNGDGIAPVAVFASGRWRITAIDAERGSARVELDVELGRTQETLELRLSRGVACSGEIQLEGLRLDAQREATLIVADLERGLQIDVPIRAGSDRPRFDVAGLEPGQYHAVLWTGSAMSAPVQFELGPGGERNLVLRMQARQ
ncbi:MAG: sigma-70 family RNA polymerase sigma factor [Planctomycetes bacterium]|nr:sigma-70 family RNA polymerase sigma factor [Planctomycetota bacterium]